MNSRTDIHKPSTIDPAEYIEVGFGDSHISHHYPGYENAVSFDGHFVNDGHCDHCGTGAYLVNRIFFLHKPTNTVITVGERCAGKIGLESRPALERKRILEREATRAKKQAFIDNNALNLEVSLFLMECNELQDKLSQAWTDGEHGSAAYFKQKIVDLVGFGAQNFVSDLLYKFNKYGTLSERQVEVLTDIKNKAAAAKKLREEEALALKPVPVTDERIEIVGTVYSVKETVNDYGEVTKIGIKTDADYKIYGNAPSSLAGVEKGDRVSFMARVKPKVGDEFFGYFNRPTKGVFV